MFVQFLVFPPVARRYGVLNCLRGCTMVFPIAYFLTPFTVLLPTPITQQVAVLCVILIKCCAGVFAFPCVTILLTNSARSLQLLGTLNGVATSLSAVGRAAGPAIAGGAFTFGVDIGYVTIPWWTLAFFAVLGNVPVWWLKEMDGFGDAEESASEDEEEEEDNLLAVSGDGVGGATSSSIQTAGIDNPVGVKGSSRSQSEDDFAVEDDDFGEYSSLTRAEMGAKNLGHGTHLRPEDAGLSKRTSSPLGLRESIGPGGGRRLSNGIGQSMNEFGSGGSPYQ
jgi:hypothetical protein